MSQTQTIMGAWTVTPTSAPQPVRHCPTCAQSRNFASSGRVRLNANGKRLDAWLIYKCTQCDQTWNRPLLDRKPVSQISAEDLDAMQHASPAWVRARAFDLLDLKRHCAHIHHPPAFEITKQVQGHMPDDWSKIILTLTPQVPLGIRADRILCAGWHLSRSQFQKACASGALTLLSHNKTAHKRPLRASVTLEVSAARLSHNMRLHLTRHLTD